MPDTKSPLLSKTLWINLLMALSALFLPAVGVYVSAHPDLVVLGVTVLNMILRVVTKTAIQIGD